MELNRRPSEVFASLDWSRLSLIKVGSAGASPSHLMDTLRVFVRSKEAVISGFYFR